MSTAPAPRPFEAFDEGFDVDMEFDDAPAVRTAGPARGPMPFMDAADVASAGGYNPVGEVVAQAEASLAEPYPATTELAPAALTPTGLAPAAAIGEVSVPRIAIHVFAERQDTLAAAERAAQDRRLSRATTQIRIGGVAAAVETGLSARADAAADHRGMPEGSPDPVVGGRSTGRGLRRRHQGHRGRGDQRHHPVPRTDAARGQRISGRAASAAAVDRGHRRPVQRPGPALRRPHHRLRRRARRGGGLGRGAQHRLCDLGADRRQHRHRRL